MVDWNSQSGLDHNGLLPDAMSIITTIGIVIVPIRYGTKGRGYVIVEYPKGKYSIVDGVYGAAYLTRVSSLAEAKKHLKELEAMPSLWLDHCIEQSRRTLENLFPQEYAKLPDELKEPLEIDYDQVIAVMREYYKK